MLVDRFTVWPVLEFCGARVGSGSVLVKTPRRYFVTFGVPGGVSGQIQVQPQGVFPSQPSPQQEDRARGEINEETLQEEFGGDGYMNIDRLKK